MTREEAIKVVMENYPHVGFSGSQFETALRTLIPELAESEDERIRRKMIEHFKSKTKETWCNMPVKGIIAYLEKQKEQKPSDLPAGFYYIDLDGNKYYSKEFRYGDMKMKVKEQKPEWSEEDEKVIEAACALLCEYAGYYKEKDMEAKDLQLFKVSQRLKSLRPQPQWKPSEKEIAAFENMLKGEFPDGIFPGVTLSELLAKLKKLYYNESISSWKPSEEQMKALKYVNECVFLKDSCKMLGLKTLYEDLKKL